MPKRSNPITGRPLRPKIMKPERTRKIIRRHHELLKKKALIERRLDTEMESPKRSELSAQLSDLEKEITEGGGLERYQEASIAGQLDTRGGDSSKVMMEWLHELMPQRTRGLRLLELGCLRIDNACSRSGFFDFIERIDLHSQHPDILEQDFMDRPLPKSDEDKFDAISCSLVVNYVPDPKVRGDMLVRTATFLRTISHLSPFPCLFLVLPAPCVRNSRYFDEKTLLNILDCIGYKLVESKETSRICYWLLKLDKKPKIKPFRKRIVNDGRNRNNFTIVLES